MSLFVKYLISNILLILFIIIFFPKDCKAIENYQLGNILFSDNFSTNLSNWQDEASGGWSINTGNLLGVKTTAHVSGRLTTTSGSNLSNYSVEVDVNNNAGVDEGIGFRRLDANNAYELNLRHGNGPYNTPEIKLTKIQNGTTTTLKDITITPLINLKWYHIKIEVVEDHIQVFLDSNLLFELDDNGTLVKSGPVSLSFWTGDYGVSIIRFDNLKVTSLSKQYNPVIFIPGIGGSEFKASQDIIWSEPDGHGDIFSHAYPGNEKVWVNEGEAVKLGDDDYFDILRFKSDGQTPEASLSLNGTLTSFTYPDIDPFFASLGYIKDTNYFVFIYDWRNNLKTDKELLDSLIETAKQKTGRSQVDIVAHSMGGLIARYYISDPTKSSKVNKLITLGTPFLGTPQSLKALLYGQWISYTLPLIGLQIGVIPNTEVKDIFSNFPSVYELLPNKKYFDFYDNSDTVLPYPFDDEIDIDKNNITGFLDFNQTKNLISNLGGNNLISNMADDFNNLLADLNQINSVKFYEIAGVSEPTLGEIVESYLISWPIKILPYYDEIYINGDSTVPVYSATLHNEKWNLSGNAKIYYVEQKHSDLVSQSGDAMQIVKSILQEGDIDPAKFNNLPLEGTQISADSNANLDLYDQNGSHTGLKDGSIENKIPQASINITKNTKNAFVKKTVQKVMANISPANPQAKSTNLKVRTYQKDEITKISFYQNIPLPDSQTIAILNIEPDASPVLLINDKLILPTSEATGSAASDHVPPQTLISIDGDKDSNGDYVGEVKIILKPSDNNSGVLSTSYSLDNGQTIQNYTQTITISSPGTTDFLVSSTDLAGNQEIPQSVTFKISSPTFSSPSPSTTSTQKSQNTELIEQARVPITQTQKQAVKSIVNQNVLGVKTQKIATKTEERTGQKIPDMIQKEEKSIDFKVIGFLLVTVLVGLLPIICGFIIGDQERGE